MAQYGWRDIHYSNAFLPEDRPMYDNAGTWSIGVYTGPDNTLCVKECSTREEAAKFASPKGNSITEAITKARLLLEGRHGCRRSIFPPYYRVACLQVEQEPVVEQREH